MSHERFCVGQKLLVIKGDFKGRIVKVTGFAGIGRVKVKTAKGYPFTVHYSWLSSSLCQPPTTYEGKYAVFNVTRKTAPTVYHKEHEDAQKEALRLACKHPCDTFTVIQVIDEIKEGCF